MIFVTVGTHEQQFNRLIEKVDQLRCDGEIEEVVMQTGFCTYEPKHCKWKKLISYEEMHRNIQEARIVITHGGPASFIAPLQIGKIPIVVPRQKQFGEHVNDHQMEFGRVVKARLGSIILIEDIEKLLEAVREYEIICNAMSLQVLNHNQEFNKQLTQLVKELGV